MQTKKRMCRFQKNNCKNEEIILFPRHSLHHCIGSDVLHGKNKFTPYRIVGLLVDTIAHWRNPFAGIE